eukprot:TRINITY_DN3767_c0_g1_i1.p1 TRINITY_DN3767_c0_g1~~TRINITY_DN3767_c0_g1_i1.p1  ORF type:complete len:238 (-),score=62.97 TRINITY_DN3767_c0_g1_i1:107-820(-)
MSEVARLQKERREKRQMKEQKAEKAESRVEPLRVEPKAETRIEPRKEIRVDHRIETRKEPRVEPKLEPRKEARIEPKLEPRKEAGVEPKLEPRIQPRVEPKLEPRKEPKLEPRVVATLQTQEQRYAKHSNASELERALTHFAAEVGMSSGDERVVKCIQALQRNGFSELSQLKSFSLMEIKVMQLPLIFTLLFQEKGLLHSPSRLSNSSSLLLLAVSVFLSFVVVFVHVNQAALFVS